jgi:hypothetical protein
MLSFTRILCDFLLGNYGIHLKIKGLNYYPFLRVSDAFAFRVHRARPLDAKKNGEDDPITEMGGGQTRTDEIRR